MGDKVVVLTGGVGGAKLALGLSHVVPPQDLTAIVNTGDDFHHLGLHVSPDIDTLLYTLSGRANQTLGWGREGETWSFMAALREQGAEDWFNLGDGDLALHVLRTLRLGRGDGLAAVTADFAARFGIALTILPMSEEPVTTTLHTDEGVLEFQRYFVGRRCEPCVRRITFEGAAEAQGAPGVVDAIGEADLVLVAPSNPYLSVDPLLAVNDIQNALAQTRAPVVAVSPLVGGESVKGPTAKLMRELGRPVSNQTIADHYEGLIDGLLIDEGDPAPEGPAVGYASTLMRTLEDRIRVARAALELACSLKRA